MRIATMHLPTMIFFFSSRRRHTRYWRDWSSDVCSSDLSGLPTASPFLAAALRAALASAAGGAAAGRRALAPAPRRAALRSEERRVGKSVDLGGRRIIKKKKEMPEYGHHAKRTQHDSPHC